MKNNSVISLPSPFARALAASEYTKGKSDFTVTQLISPPQRTWLAVNNQKITDEYASFMALLGTAVHSVLEKYTHAEEGEMAEVRNFCQIRVKGTEVSISGQMDYWKDKCLYDYKVTGGVQEKAKDEHYKQVQMNAYLANKNGIHCEYVGVVYFQRDWKYMQSKSDPSYPKTPLKVFVHPYNESEALAEIEKDVLDHYEASVGNPRQCTPDEQWAKPDTFAVKKPDAKRARRVYESEREAIADQKTGEIIEKRPGEKTYCDSFCGFANCCPQYKAETIIKLPTA
jgi:hypothetical protein